MSIDIDNVRSQIEIWEDRLDKWDGVIKVADTTLLDTEKVLAKTDEVLDAAQKKAEEARELAEQKLDVARELAEENKHHLPKVAIGLAVLGLALGAVVVLKKRRKAAEQWQVLEQPDFTDELKKTVTEAQKSTQDMVQNPADSAPEKVEATVDSAAHTVDETKAAVQDKANDAQEAATEAADDLKGAADK